MQKLVASSTETRDASNRFIALNSSLGQVSIDLVGVPRVTAPCGQDLTPRGVRKRAILGMVALSPNNAVSRRWLEVMLWPESDSARASASLRQAIAGIRREFSEKYDVLKSDRLDVGLDRSRVRVDVLDSQELAFKKLLAGRDLLEGIDISSEDFEDWLRQERSTLTAQAENAKPDDHCGKATASEPPQVRTVQKPLIVAETQSGQSAIEMFVAECIVGQLGQTATQLIRTDFRVLDDRYGPVVQSPSSSCLIRVQELNGKTYVLLRLSDRMSGRMYWNRRSRVEVDEDESIFDAAASLATEAAEVFATKDANSSELQIANAMAVAAIDDIFSFDPQRLLAAQDKLTKSNEIDPHAPRPALCALAKAFSALEDPGCNREDLKDIVRPLIEQSRQLDPSNPIALAFLADVADHVFDDIETAMGLAKSAIRSNAGFGYAYASLSAMELLQGQADNALASARKAHSQLSNTSLEILSLMRLCVASMNAGLTIEAMDAAQRAADLAPLSCPPLRHLYALKLAIGDRAGARSVLKRLRTVEPEFSMKRLREDLGYPSPSIRRMGYHKLPDVDL